MAYTKTDWKDRIVQKPNTFTMVTNADGTVTLTPTEGTITEVGTPLNANNLNKMEQGISDALSKAESALPLSGGMVSGDVEIEGITILDDEVTFYDGVTYTELLASSRNDFKVYKSGKDANGIFTTVQYKRTDGTLAIKSVLSGGTSPNYTTRTITYYRTNGTTVIKTVTRTLSYDSDGVLTNEV